MSVLIDSSSQSVCVDLDGTLTHADHLHELLASIAIRTPWRLIGLGASIWRGKAFFKQRAAELGTINAALLPYNTQVLEFLQARKAEGARLYLVTAADVRIAQAIADHLRLFDGVFSSDGRTNLSGPQKAELLTKEFGDHGFTYLGNSDVDLPVWAAAGRAVIVSSSYRLRARARKSNCVIHEIPGRQSPIRSVVHALRPHQWMKNVIIFAPLVASHQITNPRHLAHIAVAFAAFSAAASSIYIINDVVDLESDRRHPRKRHRPWASGALPLTLAPILAGCLLIAAAALSLLLPVGFAAVLAAYVALTSLYSLWLKREMLVDVFVLAALYTIRLVAGHAATGIAYSVWLFMFSMFLFLSLALVKRVGEVYRYRRGATDGTEKLTGRGYLAGDLEQLSTLGTGCGLMAVLVMALYITSADVQVLYARPELLLFACPLLLFWISRLWMVTHRGEMHDDPVVYTLSDPVSYVVAAGITVAILAAKFSHHLFPR